MTVSHTGTLWSTENIAARWGSTGVECRGKSLVTASRALLQLATCRVEIHMGMYTAHLGFEIHRPQQWNYQRHTFQRHTFQRPSGGCAQL